MSNILDHVSPSPVLDGVDDWPRSATRKDKLKPPKSEVSAKASWFRITRELVASTIADMDLDPAAEAEVINAFTGAGLL